MKKIRSFFFHAYLFTITLTLGVIALPVVLFGKNSVRAFAKIWTRLTLWGLKFFTGISHKVLGSENIPQDGALVAANHQSMWETIALYMLLPRPVVFFKEELTKIPIYGWWLKPAGGIAINRKGGAKALRAMQREARVKISEGEQIIIFPEGTRMSPGKTAPYKPGVAGIYTSASAPCVPVAHDSGRYWRHDKGDKLAGRITLQFLPAIAPGLDRKEFLRKLQNQIDSTRPDLENKPTTTPKQSDD